MADEEADEAGESVCWLSATCDRCGALVEGPSCWHCGAPRAVRG